MGETDLISRQAALDALCEACDIFGNDEECFYKGLNSCYERNAIMSVPSAQPEPSEVARDIATIIENEKDMRVILSTQLDCTDCIQNGGDWECDHVHCHKGARLDGYTEQIKWERDIAIQQLKDLGYGLGEKPRANEVRTTMYSPDLISRQAVKEWLLRWEGYIDKDIIARMQCRVIDIPSV